MSAYAPPTGEELRWLLGQWCLTQAEAAETVNVTTRQMRRWLSDDARMPYSALYVLASQYEDKHITRGNWRSILEVEATGAES